MDDGRQLLVALLAVVQYLPLDVGLKLSHFDDEAVVVAVEFDGGVDLVDFVLGTRGVMMLDVA